MADQKYDVIIIGAGHAGLSVAYSLKKPGLSFLIFDRGRIGESWRSQRWETFAMNTANHINTLPGETYSGHDPEGFCSAVDLVSSLEDYARKHHIPVSEYARVLSVEKPPGTQHFVVTVSENNLIREVKSKQVIVASGNANEKMIPSFASNLPGDILQIHTSEYRNAAQLPEGAILVIGSGQSGCQVTEDLLDAGRNVYLSTSAVARIPRRYRGKDIMDWLLPLGFFELKTPDVTDPNILQMKTPLLSGTGEYGHTISLQDLARRRAIILGKMENADHENVFFRDNAAKHVMFADEFSQKVKGMIDEFILRNQIEAPDPERDEPDVPDVKASCASSLTSLNLKEHSIGTVIWTTGFGGDFNYLKLPVLDKDGNPVHKNGISDVDGLYFIGLPWLRTRKSGIIVGIPDDAAFIADQVYTYHQAFA